MAVNTYRFLAMFILIGTVMSTIGFIQEDASDNERAFNLAQIDRQQEISNEIINTWQGSQDVIQSENSFNLYYGDERAQGRNFVEIIAGGFMPSGFIPSDQASNALPHERVLNNMLYIFRIIITIFAGYELFQIIIKPKVT